MPNGNSLFACIGVGYGATTSRHQITTLSSATGITATADTNAYGLSITMYNSGWTYLGNSAGTSVLGYQTILIVAYLPSGRALTCVLPNVGTVSVDVGFYYLSNVNGANKFGIDGNTHTVTVGTPFENGAATTISQLQIFGQK